MLKVSTKLPDTERHYIQNLITSGLGEYSKTGSFASSSTHELVVEDGFVVSARKIIRTAEPENKFPQVER